MSRGFFLSQSLVLSTCPLITSHFVVLIRRRRAVKMPSCFWTSAKNTLPGLTPSPRKQTYRTARKKLDTARRVQPTIPANANRRTRSGQEDSQIQSPTMPGRNNTQTMIFATEGNACTQFQSKSSHSRFTTSAIANPTHSIAKITMAYVPSTRGTVTLASPNRNVPGPEKDNPLDVQSSTGTTATIGRGLEASCTATN